ncbi:hypothetical protein PseBG33_3562 [Pseudomonas synxantha BG33R]|nr:hypothetical protein PseBG33_3562 [Pseudomonas synxantha BG33R]
MSVIFVKRQPKSGFQKPHLSSVQHRILLEPGQVLISADNKFLHTRTHFIDRNVPCAQINDGERLSDLNRYMLRMWLRKP